MGLIVSHFCRILDIPALRIVVSEKIFFDFFFIIISLSQTQGAWLAGFIKGTTIHCCTQNIKAMDFVISERKFLWLSYCKSMGANDPPCLVSLDPGA